MSFSIILYHIETCIWSLVMAYGLFCICGIKNNRRKSAYFIGSIATFVIFYILPVFLSIWEFPNPYIYVYIIRFIVLVPWAIYYLKGSKIEKICYILFYIAFIKAYVIVVSPLYNLIDSIEFSIYFIFDQMSIILEALLLYLFTLFLIRNKISTKSLNTKMQILVLYCPVSFIIILEVANPQNMLAPIIMNAILAVLLLGNVVLIYFFYSAIIYNYQKSIKLNKALEESRNKLARYNYSVKVEEKLNKERHELNNKYFYIQTLLEENKLYKLAEFLEKQTKHDFKGESKVFTGNSLMDHILNKKLREAREKKINTVVDTEVQKNIPVDDEMICTVLLNLLDNAIEASVLEKEPEIRVSLKHIQNYFVIKVSNFISDDVVKNNPNLSTSKTDKKIHGYGIKIIKEMIKKTDGLFKITSENNCFTFMVMFPLSVN